MKLVRRITSAPQPALDILDSESGTSEQLLLKKGDALSFHLSEQHYCVSCFKEIISGSECYECGIANTWKICLQCDGHKCLQYDENLLEACFGGKYCVYLALFGENVKAGVSREDRLEQRLAEQGADWGVKVFTGFNGKQARYVESMLFAKGLLERVYAFQKLEWMAQKPSTEKLLQAREKAKLLSEFKANFVEEELMDLAASYEIPPGPLVKANALNGVVVGWKGPIVFLERSGTRAFALGKALGRAVE